MISQNLQYSGIAVTPKIGNQWVLTNSIFTIAVWHYIYKNAFPNWFRKIFLWHYIFSFKKKKVTAYVSITNNGTLKYDCSFISLFLISHVILKKKRLFKSKYYFKTLHSVDSTNYYLNCKTPLPNSFGGKYGDTFYHTKGPLLPINKWLRNTLWHKTTVQEQVWNHTTMRLNVQIKQQR